LNEKDFISKQISKLKTEGIKIFPGDFCDLSDSNEINLPEENLILGKDFFGSFEITTTSGEPVLNVEAPAEAKFIVYSSRKRKKQIRVPKDKNIIDEAVQTYENYLDELLTKIKNDYKKENLEPKNLGTVSGKY
jgi:hypothetical protein